MSLYSSYCALCPRRCGADRAGGARGKCGADDRLLVGRAALHHWEEPPVSGTRGSGTVFFSNCPLRCVYCQNYELSRGREGLAISVERLADIFLELQDQGAHNINLVTATQYVPAITAALRLVRPGKLHIPVICNTSGYETAYTLHKLDGLIDGYLFDLRYHSPELARRYSRAADYPQVAAAALEAALNQVGPYTLDAEGLLVSGVIVRLLLLPIPDGLVDALAILRSTYARYGDSVCYSLMNQYTPMLQTAERFPELSAQVREEDYARLVEEALELGVAHSFMQEGDTVSESFIPAFDGTGVMTL
ncbi:MAG: radical SAM protein [Actinomycetia bacterium]|nr:radical SAM protein [Actinomycetes bacterium]